jgi:hypothetical protein
VEGVLKPMKSSQLECLLALSRTIPGFYKDKVGSGEHQPNGDHVPDHELSQGELSQRIALLEAQLGQGENTSPATTAQPQALPSDAPEQQQATNRSQPASSDETKAVAPLNMPALEHTERWSECPRLGHGQYIATRNRAGHWSFCPACVKEWNDNERWLANLLPAGDGRKCPPPLQRIESERRTTRPGLFQYLSKFTYSLKRGVPIFLAPRAIGWAQEV